MRSVIQQIVFALDKADRLRVVSIIYNGEDVLFQMSDGELRKPVKSTPVDEVEKWLAANDPDNTPGKGHS